MLRFAAILFATVSVPFSAIAADAPLGLLAVPQSRIHYEARGPLKAYLPEPGDILCSVTDKLRIRLLYRFVLVGLPTHNGIVIRMPNGELGCLEAGGGGEFRTRTTPLAERLTRAGEKAIWIRKPKAPLTEDQQQKLNLFATINENKGYSKRRALELIWIFLHDSRGPIQTFLRGRPKGERDNYVCSELIVESLAFSGVIPFDTARPSATSPRDLMVDRSSNVYINRHSPLACGWSPPALWIGCGLPSRAVSPALAR